MNEVFTLLFAWTPFLLTGFLWNIGVTVIAVVIGTAVGAWLASVRFSGTARQASMSNVLSRFFRNVPTLAFLFFVVVAMPREFSVYGTGLTIPFPLWLKAAIGLAPSVIGFTAESLFIARQNIARNDSDAALLFVPTWGTSVMISFLASSTASLVGVSEMISRSNSIIAATGTGYLIPLYLYCAAFFVCGCLVWMVLINRFKESSYVRTMAKRIANPPHSATPR